MGEGLWGIFGGARPGWGWYGHSHISLLKECTFTGSTVNTVTIINNTNK